MPASAKVVLRKNLGRALRQGHPWVFRDALAEVPTIPNGTMLR